jgi:hypothetical protein
MWPITRAKSALLIVGDMQTLSTADKNWAALSQWASGVHCVVTDNDTGNVNTKTLY